MSCIRQDCCVFCRHEASLQRAADNAAHDILRARIGPKSCAPEYDHLYMSLRAYGNARAFVYSKLDCACHDRVIFCHGCGDWIATADAYWHGGEAYCAGCED